MASDLVAHGALRQLLDEAVDTHRGPLTPFHMLALTIFEDRPGWEDMLTGALRTNRATLQAWMEGRAIIPVQALLTLRGMACGQIGALQHAVNQIDAAYGAIYNAECHGHA